MTDLRLVVAHAIRAERARTGISQQELADRLGLSRPVITKIEHGTRAVGAHELPAICRALGITLDRLLISADHRDREDLGF